MMGSQVRIADNVYFDFRQFSNKENTCYRIDKAGNVFVSCSDDFGNEHWLSCSHDFNHTRTAIRLLGEYLCGINGE